MPADLDSGGTYQKRSDRGWLPKLVTTSILWPRVTLIFWAALCFVSFFGIANLHVDTGTSTFFDRSAPAWAFYQESLEKFGGDEVIVVALKGRSEFDKQVLRLIPKLTTQFEDLLGVRRVDSISSVPVIEGRRDGSLSLKPLLNGREDLTEQEISEIARRLSKDRIAPRNLVSDDKRVFGINVYLDEDVDLGRERVVSEIRSLVSEMDAWVSGVPVFRTEVNFRTYAELRVFIPLTLTLVGFVIFLAFQRLVFVAISLGTSAIGTCVVLGAMGALGTPLSLSTMILPSILLALGCAYMMHVLTAATSATSRDQVKKGVLSVTRPVALSGLTTALGFLAMSTVRIDAIRELGIYGALGVVAILFAVLSVAPAALALFPSRGDDRTRARLFLNEVERWLTPVVIRRRKEIIGIWVAFLCVFLFGIHRLTVETDIILWFPESSPIRNSYEKIRTELAGITPINVVISSEEGESVSAPKVVSAIRELVTFLEALPEVGRSLSVADPLIQIHGGFNPDQINQLPDDSDLISQYLLLLSSMEQMEDVITTDRSAANVLVRLNVNGSERIVNLANAINGWWTLNGPTGFSASTTGVMYEFARAEEEIAYGQIRGLGLAFLAIGGVIFLIFRRPRIAISAMIPNLAPLVVVYGFMGLSGIPLDAATICLGSLALGIAVDDTIHVTNRFAEGVQSGQPGPTALGQSIRLVMPPLVFSTVAVAIGFAVIGLSEFTLIRNLGFLTAAMVVVCLLADLTLLPALLTESSARGIQSSESQDYDKAL